MKHQTDRAQLEIQVPLTDHDREAMHSKLVETQRQIKGLQLDQALLGKNLSDKIKGKRAERDDLVDSLHRGSKPQMIAVKRHYYPKSGRVKIIREDTGQVIDDRPIREDEKQLFMFPDEPPTESDDEEE